jgi:CheY-like chemotaxis protein
LLQGNLEDLPLLDIIQIVSFSKKTGYLSIQMEGGDGAIVFHEGLLVSAFTADSPPPDARLVALPGAARESAVRSRIAFAMEQLARLREGAFGFELTETVPKKVGTRDITLEALRVGINPQEMLLELAQGIDEDRAHSAAAVEASFAAPDEAVVQEVPMAAVVALDSAPASPPVPSARKAPVGPHVLPPGQPRAAAPPAPPALPPQAPAAAPGPAAAAPAAPRAAKVPRVGSDTVPPGVREPVPGPAAAASVAPAAPQEKVPEARVILLVDDEADVREMVGRSFVGAGYRIEEAGDPEEAAKAAARLRDGDLPFVLVTDLGMPATGGASFHGGFEVVKRLWKMNLRPPVLMMTESLNQSLRLRAKQMGVQAFVFKPTLSKLNAVQFEADLTAFAAKLASDVLPRLCEIAVLRGPVREKRPSLKAAEREPSREPQPSEVTRPFEFLRRRLLELRQGGDANQIATLVMKVAREYFERALLFVVKNDEVRGLGGFGLAPRDESLNLIARQITIPLSEPSVFREVSDSRKPFAGPLPQDRWVGHVMGRIGRFQSRGATLLPLVAHRETIALLFGDNPETGREADRPAALEVFVEQAGIALENVFLQRKLQSMEEKERAGLG